MGLFSRKKKKQEGAGFKFDLLGDDRDDALNEYQLEGLRILAEMEAKLEFMRRRGELIEPRLYGFRAEGEDGDAKVWFEHPMEGIELIRRFAGKPTKWFRLHDDEERVDFEPFEGEPARYRVI